MKSWLSKGRQVFAGRCFWLRGSPSRASCAGASTEDFFRIGLPNSSTAKRTSIPSIMAALSPVRYPGKYFRHSGLEKKRDGRLIIVLIIVLYSATVIREGRARAHAYIRLDSTEIFPANKNRAPASPGVRSPGIKIVLVIYISLLYGNVWGNARISARAEGISLSGHYLACARPSPCPPSRKLLRATAAGDSSSIQRGRIFDALRDSS